MPSIPSWVLAIVFWLHFLATVTWIGSLASISLLILPAISRTLEPVNQLAVIESIQKRLEPVAWFCMGMLLATGLFQLSANPHYDGFLAISNSWTLAILTKHILAVIMVIVTAVQTWEVLPSIRRLLLRKEKANPEELTRLKHRETLLLRLNMILGVLILAMAAIARIS
jgi:uncharacterized membrane protein